MVVRLLPTQAIEFKDTPFPDDNSGLKDWVVDFRLTTHHYNCGNSYVALGQRKEAIEDYSKTLDLVSSVSEQSPSDHHFELTLGQHARFNRANVHYRGEQFSKTLADFRKCQEDRFSRSDTCLGMGNALLMQEKFKDAQEQYLQIGS